MNCVVYDVIGASAKQDSGRAKEGGIDEIDVSAAKGESSLKRFDTSYLLAITRNYTYFKKVSVEE